MTDKKFTTVILSGYVDPIHVGHLEMIQEASKLGDGIIFIVNNDEQAKLKKGKSFMTQEDRATIVSMIKGVNMAFISIDKDETVCESIRRLVTVDESKSNYIFGNGGDRHNDEIPEAKVCKELIEFNIICPRHGARFDIRTGKAASLPAVVDICAYPVRVQGGNIEIGFPKT